MICSRKATQANTAVAEVPAVPAQADPKRAGLDSGGGFGNLQAIIFEEPVDFGFELRFEVGIFVAQVGAVDQIFGSAAAQLAEFEADIPF